MRCLICLVCFMNLPTRSKIEFIKVSELVTLFRWEIFLIVCYQGTFQVCNLRRLRKTCTLSLKGEHMSSLPEMEDISLNFNGYLIHMSVTGMIFLIVGKLPTSRFKACTVVCHSERCQSNLIHWNTNHTSKVWTISLTTVWL